MSTQNNFKMKVYQIKPLQGNIFDRENFPSPKNLLPFLEGNGPYTFQCGKCSHIILKNIRHRQITQAIYKCPQCGSYNQIDSKNKY